MSAKKPSGLIKYHQTKAEEAERVNQELALTPNKPLPILPPAQLKGEIAQKAWGELLALYSILDAHIISALDQGLLVDYCQIIEQLAQIDGLRSTAMHNYLKSQNILEKMLEKKNTTDSKQLLQMINAVNWSRDLIIKLDARADRKRSFLHTMRQSLYLTPRSRAGVVPQDKPPEKPKSALDKFLDGD